MTFGRYLPERVLDNRELAGILDCDPDWIFQASGIEQRRIAAPGQSIVDLALHAAKDCLVRIPSVPRIGMVIMASGTAERRFPGPAAQVAEALGLAGIPAIDLPIASAGSLFGIALAAQLSPIYGAILVLAAEKMYAPGDKNVAILFGDGAGACLIAPANDGLRIIDSILHSDGCYAGELRLELTGPVQMNGMAVIRHATRKLPEVIIELLERHAIPATHIITFLMHQANQNLIDRVARAIDAPSERFYSNIRRYGNTSSASMLIAASEWQETAALNPGDNVCFAAFGAGFHWGAVLARQS